MKGLMLATLTCVLVLIGVTAGAPAATSPALIPSPETLCPDPTDKEKLEALGKKLHALKKEVRKVEVLMKKEQAEGNRFRVRRAARHLAKLKAEMGKVETQIRALKSRIGHHPKARTAPKPGTGSKAFAVQKKVFHTQKIARSRGQATLPTRKKVQAHVRTPMAGTRHVYRATPTHRGRTSATPSALTALHRRFADESRKLHARYAHLCREKASLEARLKKIHKEVARARQAMERLKKDHALRLRKLQEAARKAAAARRLAALSATRRQAAQARTAHRTVPSRVRTPDLGAQALKELRLLRQDVHKILRLLESMHKEKRVAPPARPARQRRAGKAGRDLRTL